MLIPQPLKQLSPEGKWCVLTKEEECWKIRMYENSVHSRHLKGMKRLGGRKPRQGGELHCLRIHVQLHVMQVTNGDLNI